MVSLELSAVLADKHRAEVSLTLDGPQKVVFDPAASYWRIERCFEVLRSYSMETVGIACLTLHTSVNKK